VAFYDRARLELVSRAAVRALGFAVMVELKKYAWMRRPQRHCRVGAKGGEVFGAEFDGLGQLGGIAHGVLLVISTACGPAQAAKGFGWQAIVQCAILTDTDQCTDHL
jgi:hypothetical protein